jgi:hypothetical protein
MRLALADVQLEATAGAGDHGDIRAQHSAILRASEGPS